VNSSAIRGGTSVLSPKTDNIPESPEPCTTSALSPDPRKRPQYLEGSVAIPYSDRSFVSPEGAARKLHLLHPLRANVLWPIGASEI
jgi:hypothetical protein